MGAGVVGMMGIAAIAAAGSNGNPAGFDLVAGGLLISWGIWLLRRRNARLRAENSSHIDPPPPLAEEKRGEAVWQEVPQAAPKPRPGFVGGSHYCPKCDKVLYLTNSCSCGWKRMQIPSERPAPPRSVVTPKRDAAASSFTPHPEQTEIAESSTSGVVQTSWRPDADSRFNRNRNHLATDGTHVRSKSELVIINLLHSKRIQYEYEGVLERNGEIRRPDFTVKTAKRTYYWEHLGMLSDPGYANGWAAKQAWYASNGITTTSEGERLVITKDRPDGSLDSSELERTISALE